MEFEEEQPDGTIKIITERMNSDEIRSLVEIDLLKEELVAMQKTQNGSTIKFDLLPSKKLENMHDDRSDVCAMMCWQLAKMRSKDLLHVERGSNQFDKLFKHGVSYNSNPLSKNKNPFLNTKPNPFLR